MDTTPDMSVYWVNISKLLDSAELTVLRERNLFSSCAVRCTDFVYKHDDVRPSLSTNATAQVDTLCVRRWLTRPYMLGNFYHLWVLWWTVETAALALRDARLLSAAVILSAYVLNNLGTCDAEVLYTYNVRSDMLRIWSSPFMGHWVRTP